MNKHSKKPEEALYSEPETVYFTKEQHKEILKYQKQLGFDSRSQMLRRAIVSGLKTLDRYLPPENF